jgi:hypothetical protein
MVATISWSYTKVLNPIVVAVSLVFAICVVKNGIWGILRMKTVFTVSGIGGGNGDEHAHHHL